MRFLVYIHIAQDVTALKLLHSCCLVGASVLCLLVAVSWGGPSSMISI